MPSSPPRFDLPDPTMIGVYRDMGPEERIQAGLSATDLVRARLKAHLAEQNPEATEGEIEIAVARRLLGERG
jgi:hypothetical protein